jgi:hypothetical protein
MRVVFQDHSSPPRPCGYSAVPNYYRAAEFYLHGDPAPATGPRLRHRCEPLRARRSIEGRCDGFGIRSGYGYLP